ncbi:MAG TPA: SAM-dependent methyltransferase [Acholeplasmataceae bacterium]|nr:SAM-dependent methyltransferase [Acholeplasmataceae bacterium]
MLEELKAYAVMHHVPIINDEGLMFLKDSIETFQVKNVLEIGTAIGYSALAMASFGCKVDTFERDEEMIEQAKIHLDLMDIDSMIRLIPFDALTFKGALGAYDLIFIDAAKAQYERFFDKYVPYLNPNGIVICDNLRFHDLNPDKVNRHTRQLLRKISEFKEFLVNHPDFETSFYEIGDGMSVSQRKK